MFRRLSEPLPLSEASLLALRPALNAPVLNVGFLPVGPARAALVVFAEEYGAIGIAFGIRSVQGRQVAVLRNQEPIEETAALSEALEPALAEAERMGFLFDEDMLADSTAAARAAAAKLWADLMGELEVAGAVFQPQEAVRDAGLLDAPAGSLELTELVLEEVAPVDLRDLDHEIDEIALDLEAVEPIFEPAGPAEPVGSAASRVGPTPRVPRPAAVHSPAPAPAPAPALAPETLGPSLSKFRPVGVEPGMPGDLRAGDRNARGPTAPLGRIGLKRVRGGREGTTRRIPYLARLLSSF